MMTSKSPFDIKWPLAGFWHHLSTDIFERFWPLNHDWLILALEQGDYKGVPDSSQNFLFCRKWATCAGQVAVWIFAKVSFEFFFLIFSNQFEFLCILVSTLKYGFRKKLLRYKWTSDQLNTFFLTFFPDQHWIKWVF